MTLPGLGLKLASSLGARLPAAVTAVGKAQLAYQGLRSRCSVDGVARTGDRRLGAARSDRAGPRAESVRQQGYAVDEGQTAVGIRCVAAPLFNDGGCCGAIGVSYLMVRGLRLCRGQSGDGAAGRASARLGGHRRDGQPGEPNPVRRTR